MSKSVSNPTIKGDSDGAKQVEPFDQSGKGNENESMDQSNKAMRKETKDPERRKEGKVELGHQFLNQIRWPRKVKCIEREEVAILHQKTAQPIAVTHLLQSGFSRLAKIERFHVVKQEGVNKYNLPADLAEHANEYCNTFIFEKEVKKSILFNHPVPNNAQGIEWLDSFMQDILKDKSK